MKTTREKVQRMKCPVCFARTKTPCVDENGRERIANHQERVERYARYKLHKQPDFNRAEAQGLRLDVGTRQEFRDRIRKVPCPRCGAGVDELCHSRRPQGRLAVHPERSAAYASVYA